MCTLCNLTTEPSAQDAVEAKTINRFEKAVRDINGRKVRQWLLKAKKASNSGLRKSLNCRLLQAGKGLERSIAVAGPVLTLLF